MQSVDIIQAEADPTGVTGGASAGLIDAEQMADANAESMLLGSVNGPPSRVRKNRIKLKIELINHVN